MLEVEHSAILSSFIKLSFVIKISVLFIFEWRTGFTLFSYPLDLTLALGDQKNRLNAHWDGSNTHNICFGHEIREFLLSHA